MEQPVNQIIYQLFTNLKSIMGLSSFYEHFGNWMKNFDSVMEKIISLDNTEYIIQIIHDFYDVIRYCPTYRMTDLFKIAQKLVEYYQINIHLEREYFLTEALRLGYYPLIQYLVNHGADLFVCSQSNKFRSLMIELVNNVKSDENGMECFKLLTEFDINLDKYNLLMRTVLHSYWNMTTFLLDLTGTETNINPDVLISVINRSPPESLVRNLIQRGIDIHYHNDNALMIAIMNRDINIIKILLENGATVPDFNLLEDNHAAQVVQILQTFNIDSDTIVKLLCMRSKDLYPIDDD